MSDIFGIHWAGSDRLGWLAICVIMILLLCRHYYRVRKASALLVHSTHLKTVFKNFSLVRQALKTILLSSSLLFLFLALLSPQWGKKEKTVQQEGRELLVLLDISRSMSAKDLKPNRLEFAKLKIRNLISKLPTEHIGLIVFSGSAFVQCPLTADHAAFSMFLDHIDTEIMSSGTTSLDKALSKALEVFDRSEGRKNKIAVVLTDGEDFSLNFGAVEKKALSDQLHLFALGIGTPEGAPIPKFDNHGNQVGHEVDVAGNVVLSALNEKMLQQLCSILSGLYQRATYDDSDIDALAQRLENYEKEKFADKKFSLYEEQYPWFLALAWVCLALEWIL